MRPTGLTVATFNLYLGADLFPLFEADADQTLASRTAMMWSAVESSRPVERMGAAAALLLRQLPDVICVQEAALWRAGAGESARVHDLLTLLTDALAARGAPYSVVAQVNGFSSAAMSSALASTTGQLVELHDRSAILVRQDTAIRWDNVSSGAFSATMPVSALGHPANLMRAWCAAEVHVGHAALRVVNTHLESYRADVRTAQARELVAVLGHMGSAGDDADAKRANGRPVPVVVLGDINCRPTGCRPSREGVPEASSEVDGDAYETLAGTGLVDAWAVAHPDEACEGYTSGQAPDLRNPESALDHRIDVAFVDPSFTVCKATVLGDLGADRTPSGLWPSDHACLVVGLEI
jgi:endonuclease/exonuclease/phosphatase family metal-dependent hydrolase